MGTYATPDAIGRAFALPAPLRAPVGTFANQPNPHRDTARWAGRGMGVALLLLALVWLAEQGLAARAVAFTQRYRVRLSGEVAGTAGNAFVTPVFTLGGRTSAVELELASSIENAWLALEVALISEATGATRTVEREISLFRGVTSEGPWSEGSQHDRVRIGQVPPGRYFLRVAVEGDQARAAEPELRNLWVTVRRDVPGVAPYLLALVALVLPALVPMLRSATFEGNRWAQSDHAPQSGGDDDEA